MMTHFLRDILRQPNELQRTIDFLLGAGRPTLDAATTAIRSARHLRRILIFCACGEPYHLLETATLTPVSATVFSSSDP